MKREQYLWIAGIIATVLAILLYVLVATSQTVHIIDTITPDHVLAGSGDTVITIYGANLNPPSFPVVSFNAIAINASGRTANSVTVTIPAIDLKYVTSYAVTVNSTPVTNAVRFQVLSPLASVTSTVPAYFSGSSDTPVDVRGQGFTSSATILFDWQPVTTTFVSSTELTATIPGTLIGNSTSNPHHILVYNGSFTAGSLTTVSSLNVIGSDQPQLSLSNIAIGTSLTGTATARSIQGTVTLGSPYYTITGPDSADFSNSSSNCANGKVLVNGAACNIQITATPSAFPAPLPSWEANHSYALNDVIIDNANGNPNGTPHLQEATTGGTSGAGTTPIMGGVAYPDFLWNESGGTTADGPDTLVWTDQGPYTISISESATLTVNSNAANNPQTIPLSLTKTVSPTGSGSLVIGNLAINPAGYDFGTVVQSTPTSRTFTLQNGGGNWMTLSSPFYTVTGTNAGDFTVSGGTCAANLFLGSGSGTITSPGQTCTFTTTFTPSGATSETANLNLFWSSIGGTTGTVTYVFTGTGKTAGTKISLVWVASTSGSVTGYKVYRGSQPGGPYTLLASPGNVTSYDDTTPVHGNTYCYVVAATGTSPPYNITSSANSNESCATF